MINSKLQLGNLTYMDIYLTTKETPFCLPGEYKKDELLESARYAF